MLILPAERGIDWRRAPVATAAIVLLCCLVYFFWQWNDDQRWQAAAEYYTEHNLLELEYPNFLSHLHQNGREPEAMEVASAWDAGETTYVTYAILSDLSFAREMDKTDADFWGDDVYFDWASSRSEVNALVTEISAFKLGLVPAQSRPITYISYQFMHGSTLHLIGNMVVLGLTGAAVEAAIGSTYFLLCYLFCGVIAGLVFTLFNLSGLTPLVGASGSISGVMGMYVALYGLRKIKFFYSVVFYFGYFTAPALVMLPVWLGWELINAIWGGNDGVAYIAHAGGLLAGGLGMLAVRKHLVQVEETYLDQAPDEDQDYRRALDDYQKQLAGFNFESARRKLDHLEANYPDRNAVKEQRYYLEKLRPDTEAFHRYAHSLLNTNSTDPATIHMIHEIYKDYESLIQRQPLDDATLLKLMHQFCQIDAWNEVSIMVKQAQQRQLRDPVLVKILRVLARGIKDTGERHLSSQFATMADNLEQSLANS